MSEPTKAPAKSAALAKLSTPTSAKLAELQKTRLPKSPNAKNRMMVEGKPHWVISSIVGVKKNTKSAEGGLLYLVNWAGYPASTRSWEPEVNCIRGLQKIFSFFKNIHNREKRIYFQSLSKLPAVKNNTFGKERKLVHKRQGSVAVRKTKKDKVARKMSKRLMKVKKQEKKIQDKKKSVKRCSRKEPIGQKATVKRRTDKAVKPAK